ncbi:uroporphyrinogen-III C-methyltransferase [Billgrantia sp. C5P2]|uniref:uroporphyrinogen-III C-methyltransferase n=1 Tax=Billgrantia sp. C5P2 TaxID=3436239 RepID=UPI003DA677AA
MSKQTNEQDEQKAPSAKGQDDKGRKAAAKDEPGSGAGKGRSQRGSSSPPPVEGKAGEQQPAAPADAPVSQGKSATVDGPAPSAAKSADTAPAPDQAAAKPESDKPTAAKPESDKPATTGSKGGDAKPAAAGKTPASDKPDGNTAKAASPGGGGTPPAATSAGGKGSSNVAGVLALILVLFLGIGAGLFAWNTWERLDAQQQRLAELDERASTSADDFASLRDRLESGEQERDAALAEAVESMQGEFASYRSEVDETLDQVLDELSREQDTDEREWLHAEAAYLLRLANQRLQLERDVEGAAALLRTADARLNEADNPALLSVRRAIASELSILDGVPEVDRTGLYLALNSQQERLAQLPLSRELEEIPARSGIEEAPSGGWQDQLSRFGQELKDLVVIRHHDEALEGLVTPEQESYLRQSARLVLEQAQLALLKEEQELYEASIDKALELIRGYYDTERSEVQAVMQRLEELKGETIQPELPDISGSQQALAEFIERRFGSRGGQGDEA